jgi:hypothetical protein
VNGIELIRHNDPNATLLDGGIALVCEEGLIMTDEVKMTAASPALTGMSHVFRM